MNNHCRILLASVPQEMNSPEPKKTGRWNSGKLKPPPILALKYRLSWLTAIFFALPDGVVAYLHKHIQ